MTYKDMIAKLERRDISGVGVLVTYYDRPNAYFFYEDFEDSKGIDRADKDTRRLIERGGARSADFFYQNIRK